MSVLECAGCKVSDEPTDEQIRDEVNKFLIKQVELLGLSVESKTELLRLVLLVDTCEQANQVRETILKAVQERTSRNEGFGSL